MAKRYGATTDVSTKLPDDLYRIVQEQIERDIIFRATKEGFNIVGNWSHRRELSLHVDEETGEPYEFYRLYSSVEVESV